MREDLQIVLILIFIIFFFPLIVQSLIPWARSRKAGTGVSLSNIIFMRFRKIPAKIIIDAKIMADKSGLNISTVNLESHYLAGGNVTQLVRAMITAREADMPLEFNRAAAIDLVGHDVLEKVRQSIQPKVLETPVVAAMAKDGTRLQATAKVTVRTSLDRLVDGAGEETVLHRVCDEIATRIMAAESHKTVLENPGATSKKVLAKNCDAGTAYEILAIELIVTESGDAGFVENEQ